MTRFFWTASVPAGGFPTAPKFHRRARRRSK